MKYVLFIAVFLWGLTSAHSQNHSTCDDAIPVTTSSYGPITPEGWADSSLCLPNNPTTYFGKSHPVIWFSFVVPYDTILTFQIIPEHSGDDFDFILFKSDRGDFCQKEKQRKIQPIRTNFAKPTKYSKGITGLSAGGTDAYIAPGYNSPYSSAVPVKKGEWYYIVVDNYINDKGGFVLKLPFRFNASVATEKSTIDAAPIKAPAIISIPDNSNFYIHVLDSTNHPIQAKLIIDGIQRSKSIKIDTSDYSLHLEKYQSIKIRANAKGYMPYQSSYSATGDTSAATFWVHLEPIKAAENITLKDIQFEPGNSVIKPESKPGLDYVLQFLLSNPDVKIIIKGYVNDPNGEKSEKYDQALSETRANAVKSYLAARGINKNRMNCVGYGSSKMLYIHPKTNEEQAANRRVEIEIQ